MHSCFGAVANVTCTQSRDDMLASNEMTCEKDPPRGQILPFVDLQVQRKPVQHMVPLPDFHSFGEILARQYEKMTLLWHF